MNLFLTFRSNDWWEFKIPPLLAIGYATCFVINLPVYEAATRLLFLLASLLIGAIYVSIINDVTDVNEDLACGKANRMSKFSPSVRYIFPLFFVIGGVIFGYFFRDDIISLVLYSLSWISFSLYSINPFRFKKRAILGLLCDAAGSHLFPSLLMVSSITHFSGQDINYVWISTVGIWAFCYGLRGILWHQFIDRDKDIQVGLNTFASNVTPNSFKFRARTITIIELLALCIMISFITSPIVLVFILLCFLLLYIRIFYYKNKIIEIIPPQTGDYHILLSEYYQLLLPVSILLSDAVRNPLSWILLALHLVIFPKITRDTLRDLYAGCRILLKTIIHA